MHAAERPHSFYRARAWARIDAVSEVVIFRFGVLFTQRTVCASRYLNATYFSDSRLKSNPRLNLMSLFGGLNVTYKYLEWLNCMRLRASQYKRWVVPCMSRLTRCTIPALIFQSVHVVKEKLIVGKAEAVLELNQYSLIPLCRGKLTFCLQNSE
jgi:hypothetical protein